MPEDSTANGKDKRPFPLHGTRVSAASRRGLEKLASQSILAKVLAQGKLMSLPCRWPKCYSNKMLFSNPEYSTECY